MKRDHDDDAEGTWQTLRLDLFGDSKSYAGWHLTADGIECARLSDAIKGLSTGSLSEPQAFVQAHPDDPAAWVLRARWPGSRGREATKQVRASSIRSLSTSLSDWRPVSFIRCSSQRRVSKGNRVLMLVSSIVLGVRAMCRKYSTGRHRVTHDSYVIK
jgi:hypothetical protein